MQRYKRNQVEEALSRTLGEMTPGSELRTRVKRLLELDRRLGRKPRSAEQEMANYAFYSTDPPGRGVEVWFSDYEAFALMTGLRLMQHGWPQSFPVSLLRGLRPKLERQHARILNRTARTPPANTEAPRAGDLALNTADPVLLVIGSRHPSAQHPPVAVYPEIRDVFEFVRRERLESWSLFELADPARELHAELSKAEPRKRGRSG